MRQTSRTQMNAGGTPRLAITPPQIVGPFYPVTERPDLAANLARPSGSADEARGQLLYVRGRVLTRSGEPVPHARIEIWQANAAGKYRHPSDTNPAPLDPNFRGFAQLTTDVAGRYALRTIKPGRYPTPEEPDIRPSRHPFHELPNVIMTPHCSAWTEGMARRRGADAARNIDRFIRGERLLHIVATT